MKSIFYKVKKESHKDILLYALTLATKVFVDTMANDSWDRKRNDSISQTDAIDLIMKDKRHHFVFIHRQNQGNLTMIAGEDSYFETGSSTMCKSPEYFIFIYLTETNALKVMKKFRIYEKL